jgi:hypothetical protein
MQHPYAEKLQTNSRSAGRGKGLCEASVAVLIVALVPPI